MTRPTQQLHDRWTRPAGRAVAFTLALGFATAFLLAACGESTDGPGDAGTGGTGGTSSTPEEEHVHGPHEGHLTPLGSAGMLETVLDAEAGSLTLYVLKPDGKTPLPITGVPQVKISSAAQPAVLEVTPRDVVDGKSSEFHVQSDALKGEPEGRISIELDGKTYNPDLGHGEGH